MKQPSTKLVVIAANATIAKLQNDDQELKLLLSDLLSYQTEGAEFSNAYQIGHWDGRSSFFNYSKRTFPAGFVEALRRDLEKRGYEIQVVKKPLPEPLGPLNVAMLGGRIDSPQFSYQKEVVERLLKYGSMIARLATGAGKSYAALMVIAKIKRPTLFLTTRTTLMYQMKEYLEKAGMKVGVLGDGEWNPSREVNVATVQTIIARLKEPYETDKTKVGQRQRLIRAKTLKILEMFEVVVGEEAHEAGGNSYFDILKHCKNAYYRLALTATPFMRMDTEANMRLMAAFGGIGIEISEKELIDKGVIARPIFKYIEMKKPRMHTADAQFKHKPWQKAYVEGVVEHPIRNQTIVTEAVRAVKHGLSVIVLIQHKKHGHILQGLFNRTDVKAEFIYGETDQETRRDALDKLGRKEIHVLIGSTILDIGVDVPSVGMIVLAGGGKAEVATRQRIGRGLRAKKKGPNVALILDFLDIANKYLKAHSLERKRIVQETEGFKDGILGYKKDYDYGIFRTGL